MNRKLFDAVAKEIFFTKSCLFVEGQEDAHVIANYCEAASLPPLEVFGYGAGGAPNIINWITMACEINIRCAALFDGDEAGTKAFHMCKSKFDADPNVLLEQLWTDDIRDKTDPIKVGIFTDKWVLKPEHEERWSALIARFTDFLGKEAE